MLEFKNIWCSWSTVALHSDALLQPSHLRWVRMLQRCILKFFPSLDCVTFPLEGKKSWQFLDLSGWTDVNKKQQRLMKAEQVRPAPSQLRGGIFQRIRSTKIGFQKIRDLGWACNAFPKWDGLARDQNKLYIQVVRIDSWSPTLSRLEPGSSAHIYKSVAVEWWEMLYFYFTSQKTLTKYSNKTMTSWQEQQQKQSITSPSNF